MNKVYQLINHKLQVTTSVLPAATRKLLIAFFLILGCQASIAQIYPVQVNPQLIPPYSLKLSDYQTTTSEKLFVNILLTDTQEIGRRVRLKMRIEGNGYAIQNTDVIAGATPIFLDGGINLRLSNLDLQPYFELNNLQGITPQQYNQPLASGRYDFCFEVYDFFSGQLLSRKSCFPVYLILNDPPLLNLPSRGDLVSAQNPQNVLFSWTPRHLNATGVQYEFTLKELWDTTLDPQAAFLNSAILFQTTTFTSTLLYGPADIPLLEGKRYAWQVRAIVTDGISETSVFKNNGYSEIFNFTYQGNCDVPKFVMSEAQNTQTVEITWLYSDHIRYQIQYRKKGYGDADWFSLYAYNQQSVIYNLEAATTYEFRVGGECTAEAGFAYSGIQEFTTPSESETAYYNCGITPEIKITNNSPLPSLKKGETFTAGDFPVVTVELSGSGGSYSGWGYITLPFLEKLNKVIDIAHKVSDGAVNIGKYTRIKVEFKNVQINTDYQLTQGVVETSYDPTWKNIGDVDAALDKINGSDGEITAYNATAVTLTGVKVVDGKVVLLNKNGTETTIDTKPPVVITDKTGKTFTVNEQGEVEEGKAAEGGAPNKTNTNGVDNSGNVNLISSKDVEVIFEPGKGKYTFDTNPNQDKRVSTSVAHNATYETIKKADGGNYYVHYKAVANTPFNEPDRDDEISATVSFSNGKTKEDLVFKTPSGEEVNPSWSGNIATFKLTKKFDYAKDAIIATVKPADSTAKYEVAGKIDLWHLSGKQVNVVLVSINGAPIPDDATTELNEIYNKTGISFNVSTVKKTITNSWGTTIETGNSDALNTYTNGQQLVTQAVIAALGTDYKTNTYYMLYTNEKASNGDAGFMPLIRQFGFVFDEKNRTLAHELGHGVFGLIHPFSKDGDKLKTNLLMDYGAGKLLSHNDWEMMYAPGLQLYQYTQGSSAGALAGGYGIAPDYTFVSNGDETTVAYLELAKKGFLGGLVKDSKKYKWSTNKYVCDEKDSTLKIETIATIADGSKIYLFFDNDKPIKQNKYLRTVYNEELKEKLATKDPAKLSAFVDKYVTDVSYKQKEESRDTYWGFIACDGCNSDGAKQDVVDVNNQNLKIIRDCGTDAYVQKSLFTYNNDVATWGGVIVKFLDHNLNENKKNKSGDDLNTVNLGGLRYINPSQRYNGNPIFQPSYIEELNNKLAYLEVSAGIQLHINFIETTCTFTQKEGDKFAKDIFEASAISKTKGIYTLIVRNINAQNVLEWKTYFAYGSDISDSIKNSSSDLLGIDSDSKFKSFGKSLFQFYKIVPKKQLQYIYEIELATKFERNNPEEFEYKPILKNINGKIATVESQTGNAVITKIYFKDTETDVTKELNETDNVKELKEEFVAEQGLNLAVVYAETFAGWKLYAKDISNTNPSGEITYKPIILDCKFTLNQSCTGEIIDKAFLVAGIASAPFGNVAIVIDGLAVIYYGATGEGDTALMYVSGYAIGPLLGATIKGIANITPNIIRFTEGLYVKGNLILKLEQGITKEGVEALLRKELSSGVKEWMIPNAEYGNVFVKATDNEILVGYVKTEQNVDKLVILADKKSTHSLSNKLEKATDVEVREAFKIVQGAGSLITTATKAITKSKLPSEFVDALKALGKSEDDILEYFTKYHNDNGFKFLNEVEDLVTQYPSLTRAEAYTLWGYTTDNFYFQLNDWLRRGVNTSQTQAMKNILQSALAKVPKYNGTAFRAIKLDGQALTDFLSKHNVGDIVTYDEFVSCGSTQTAAFFNKPGKNIQLTMEVNNAPVISDFADGIKFRGYGKDELLLLSGKKFKILSKELDNGIYKISVVQQ
ncbi:hypothetical protein [Flavobacterium sp.]|uniref:hypothetical protein n=1 Tax=Flavobacterium sp. TaxID=239 RepID=UPI00261BFE6B|nr:hypothetical protein [Flavobacterium sp.]MDG2431390.1 hypothetical protein [Flavobacterium sp.]